VNLRKMHSCRRSTEKILDLVFNELGPVERERLKEQLHGCPACLSTLEEYSNTLAAFDTAAEAGAPGEAYWSSFEAALEQKIRSAGDKRLKKRPFFSRLLTARVTVPVPLAAGFALLLFAAIAGLTYSRGRERVVEVAVPGPEQAAQIKYVEVPMIKEKVVTRTVYVPKPVRFSEPHPKVFDKSQLATFASVEPPEKEEAGSITRANLEGFLPAEDMKLRIIRRSENGGK
jgi:Putative zinc-finger